MTESEVEPQPFSDRLEEWLQSDSPKTLGELDNVFGEKSFAVAILVLMFLPALPLPTGGISHLFEAISVVLAAQMVIGAGTLWLPERWKARPLGDALTGKAIPLMARRIRWFERFSKPRGAWLLDRKWFIRLIGLGLIVLAVAAALAPPFSGLDTFPALGAVVVCLGIILEDIVLVAVGALIGAGGVTLILTVGAAVVKGAKSLFN